MPTAGIRGKSSGKIKHMHKPEPIMSLVLPTYYIFQNFP